MIKRSLKAFGELRGTAGLGSSYVTSAASIIKQSNYFFVQNLGFCIPGFKGIAHFVILFCNITIITFKYDNENNGCVFYISKRWRDGSPVVFQRWDINQPNSQNNFENCAVMSQHLGE